MMKEHKNMIPHALLQGTPSRAINLTVGPRVPSTKNSQRSQVILSSACIPSVEISCSPTSLNRSFITTLRESFHDNHGGMSGDKQRPRRVRIGNASAAQMMGELRR